MDRILIVDDEARIREVLREYASYEGFEVTEAEDGLEAVRLCREHDYDVVVMDIMMPRLDGYSACKEIRRTKDIPFLMLSARGEVYDKLFGFEVGIDDYVVKPFSPKEVMARLHVILQRRRAHPAPPAAAAPAGTDAAGRGPADVFEDEGLLVDFSARTARIDGARIDLTPKEYELLRYLVRNRNIALTREKLLTEVWGYDFFGDDRTVDTHVKMLRASLGRYRDRIVTLRGVGYRYGVG